MCKKLLKKLPSKAEKQFLKPIYIYIYIYKRDSDLVTQNRNPTITNQHPQNIPPWRARLMK